MPDRPTPVDDYVAALPTEKRRVLKALAEQIRTLLPGAEEIISYGLPAFRFEGKTVVGFAANKSDYSLYPFSGSAGDVFQAELADRLTTKGSIHFTAEDPIPADLLRRIVEWRVESNRGK